MLKLLKVCGRGIVTVILLPVIVLVWVLYGIYCLGLFIFMFFKGTIDFFKGKDFDSDMIEDIEAKRTLLEKEKADKRAKEALDIIYQNALAKASLDQQASAQPAEPVSFEQHEYGPDVFNSASETKSDNIEEENHDATNND